MMHRSAGFVLLFALVTACGNDPVVPALPPTDPLQPVEDPTDEPLPSPERPGRARGEAPRATPIHLVNATGERLVLHRGAYVERDHLERYVGLTFEADSVPGRLTLDGAGPRCPELRLPVLSNVRPCMSEDCVLALEPGARLEIPWTGWLLAPDAPAAEPTPDAVCFRRRAPLPTRHLVRVCADASGGRRACAETTRELPSDGPVVLTFDTIREG